MSTDSKRSYFTENSVENSDVVDIIVSKGYLPPKKSLPHTSLLKSSDDEVTYLLSKLPDEELVKLLYENTNKNEYNLNHMIIQNSNSKLNQDPKIKTNPGEFLATEFFDEFINPAYEKQMVSDKKKPPIAVFRLDNKQVNPYSELSEPNGDRNYNAIQKLSNLLHSLPIETDKDKMNTKEEEKKELLFDILMSQLKTLCCKKKPKKKVKKFQLLSKHNEPMFQNSQSQERKIVTNEQMFLIINDEIKSNESNKLISVDPDSLDKNSRVLLLGPITTPITDSELKSLMLRISAELSKPKYVPLLLQLSRGTLSGNNVMLMKNLITGPETRRYIKPHRCNHQSKLAKIYGGPKWLICTGYLNINTPSLYD